MFIKIRKYLAPIFLTEDFRIQVRGPPANYVFGCHMTPVARGALGYVSYQKGIIQGHLLNRYAPRRAPALCSRIVFRTVLSLDVSIQIIFLYCMSVKKSLRGYLGFCWRPDYALVITSNKWNQYYFSTLKRLAIWGHRWILVLMLILDDWYKHSNTNVCGFQVHFESILVYDLKTKSDFFYQNVRIT